MDKRKKMDSLADVIHKEKNQKKTTDKSTNVHSPLDDSSIVQGNTAVKSLTEQLVDHQNSRKSIGLEKLHKAERLRKQTRNLEIDASLHSWVMEGLVDQSYVGWVAKCCHVLGLETANRLAISARNGKFPQRLFSSLLKGSMNLKAKQDYFDVTTLDSDTTNEMRTSAGQ